MKISIQKLETIIDKILLKDYSKEESKLIKGPVLFAELIGKKSHGIIRLGRNNFGAFVKGKKGTPKIIKRSSISRIINGNKSCGLLTGTLALKETIKVAKKNGIALVGTKNSFNSTGALSYYCHSLAKNNLIGIILSQCPPIIAPFNSVKALFGTNPIAFAFPAKKEPIIFDMSTSAIAFGDIMKLNSQEKPLPENTAIDKNGNPTTNTEKAMEGATLPFDNSYKGSGMAMMVELLSGVLPGAGFLGLNNKDGWGNLFMAFKPDLLINENEYQKRINKFLKYLRESKTKANQKIRIPGEQSMKNYYKNIKNNEVEIDDTILEKLLKENELKLKDF